MVIRWSGSGSWDKASFAEHHPFVSSEVETPRASVSTSLDTNGF